MGPTFRIKYVVVLRNMVIFVNVSIVTRTKEYITLIKNNKPLKETLLHLILKLPETYLINIDLNWSNSGYAIFYPKNTKE